MELQVTTLDGKSSGSVTLKDEIFGLEPRTDILHRMVRYQQLKAYNGTADVKNRSETALTKKKSIKQKGSGGARHGARSAPQFRGGGRAFGPTPRSHAIDLPKKVRALALKHALSAKAVSGDLVIIEDLNLAEAKTSVVAKAVRERGWKRVLVIDGASVNDGFARAARNIEGIDVLPSMGANVYDILRRDTLVITRAGVEALEARLKGAEPK